MVKKEKTGHEETQIDDLDAFEEWEGDDEAHEEEVPLETEPAPKMKEAEEVEEELDFGAFEGSDEEEPLPTAAPEEVKPEEIVAEEDFADSLVDLAPDVPVNLVAIIGKANTTVGDLMKTRVGSVIDLGRPPGETVDLVANRRLIARGELVDMDGQLGVRILKIVK